MMFLELLDRVGLVSVHWWIWDHLDDLAWLVLTLGALAIQQWFGYCLRLLYRPKRR